MHDDSISFLRIFRYPLINSIIPMINLIFDVYLSWIDRFIKHFTKWSFKFSTSISTAFFAKKYSSILCYLILFYIYLYFVLFIYIYTSLLNLRDNMGFR